MTNATHDRASQSGTPQSGTLIARRWFAPAVVLVVSLAFIALSLFAQQELPAQSEGAVSIEPIGSTVLLCPEPGAGGDLGVRVTAAVVPGLVGQDQESGSAGLRTLPGRESAQSLIRTPGGQAQIEAFGARLPAIRAFGEGALAPGFVADQWGRDPSGRGRGMASTACAPAASEFWFVGGGAIAGRKTRVLLVNPDDTAASVDVIIHGPDGIVDAPAGRGLIVPSSDRITVQLDVLAPGINATAFHIIARAGRIGASIDDDQRSGLASVGTDWIPQSALPANKVFIPGIINGIGARVLSIVSTGDSDANVTVRVMSSEGTYEPAERNSFTVTSGAVLTVDMAPALPQTPDGALPSTLELTSDQPIVAGMRQFFGGKRIQDETSFSSGAQPFTAPAAVSGLPVRDSTDIRLYLTAPESDAEVDLVLLPFAGGKDAAEATPPRRIKIGAGTVRNIKLDAPSGVDWFTAVITPVPGSGPVLAAHRVRERSQFGDLVTGYPWTPLRVVVTVPSANQNAGVALRRAATGS
jgi:hypothetical protein